MSKEQTALERTAVEEYASKIAQSILDYHKDKPVKELTDFASQAVEDYAKQLLKEIRDAQGGISDMNMSSRAILEDIVVKKLIDSIK